MHVAPNEKKYCPFHVLHFALHYYFIPFCPHLHLLDMNAMVEHAHQNSKHEPAALAQLIQVAKQVLGQAIEFVEGLTSDDQLTTESVYLPGSTIGT